MKHFAKKSMGQNFLKNPGVIEKIIAAASLSENDTVFEIGPGQGALTIALLGSAGKVIAIEKDDNLFAQLQEMFASEIAKKQLELIHGDALSYQLSTISYKLVANIPYNITGAIIEKFLSAKAQPSMMVLLVQKEVAERIVAKHKGTGKKAGTPGKESILSIAVKAYGTPLYMSTVKAGSFVPAPKVDSAIIRIEDISRKNFKSKHHEEVFFQLVKTGFAHKRKTLAGNLKNVWEPEVVEGAMRAVGLRPTARAEDVGITTWLALADFVYTMQYGTV